MKKQMQMFGWKRIFTVMAVIWTLALPIKAEAVEFTTTEVNVVMLTNDGAGFYTEPDAGKAPMFVFGAGIPIRITGITSNQWYRTDLNGIVFYMPLGALAQETMSTDAGTQEQVSTPVPEQPAVPFPTPSGPVSYQVTEEYTSTVGSVEEALLEFDKVVNMRVRKWTLNVPGGNGRAIGSQVWNEIERRFTQSVRNYNENTVRGMMGQKTSKQCVFTFEYPSGEQDAAVEAVVARILPQMNQGSDYDKVKKVHDYLCNHITYTLNDRPEIYTAYGALVEGKAVCEGYAIAFQRLMEAMGIPCYIASGVVQGEDHAWNLVQLNGQWYHLDATWDDQVNRIIYKYFLLSGPKMGYRSWGNHKNVVTMATSNYK